MRRLICIVAILLVSNFPVVSYAQTAEEFNEQVIASTDSLYLLASLWAHVFQDNYENERKFGELASIRKDLQKYIDQQLRIFKKGNDAEGSENLRNSLVSFYEFEKKLIAKSFVPFENLTPSSTVEEVNACRDKLGEEGKQEREFLTDVNKERKEYTKRNNIEFAPPQAAPKPIPKPRTGPVVKAKTAPTPPPEPTPVANPDDEDRQEPVSSRTSSGNPTKKLPAKEEKPETKTPKEKEDSDDDGD